MFQSGERLNLIQVIGFGGIFSVSVPYSLTMHADVVYVLNAANHQFAGILRPPTRLIPLPRIESAARPQTPRRRHGSPTTLGQVAFTPDGPSRSLTTKANGSAIKNLRRRSPRAPVRRPHRKPGAGAVPLDQLRPCRAGRRRVARRGDERARNLTLNPDRTITSSPLCRPARLDLQGRAGRRGVFYASNACSASVRASARAAAATLTLVGTAATNPGTVDNSGSSGSRFL